VGGADHVVEHVAVKGALAARDDYGVERGRHLGHGGRGDRGDLGDRPHRHGQARIGQWPGALGHPVGDDGDDGGVEVDERVVSAAGRGRERLGAAPLAADHRDHDAAELGRQAGVEAQLAGDLVAFAGGVGGEVAADHDDRAGQPLDLTVALDDAGDQLFPLAVGDERARLGGGEAVRLGVGSDDRVALGQQGEQRVVTGAVDERAEHPDAGDLPGEQLDQAERDRALADAGAETRHINASCHGPNLPAGEHGNRAESRGCG
jgi:hypothetical protein